MFITFEGIDGCGKTTQSKLLAKYLGQIYGENNVILSREPGGTDFAEKIREILLFDSINSISELLLIVSARYEHIKNLLLPALERGKIVICDRFIDSTIAYQGYGLGVDTELIQKLHDLLNVRSPDITFILDISVDIALSRADDKNKYEKMNIDLYTKIRKGFQNIALNNRNRCHIINDIEVKSVKQIYNEVVAILSSYMTLL
ncbi:MAG: dTMP kinase [Wolbachia endosymbiont of Fragariocoptes setiger]|nr:dTMP kinase [Wolbachia endosymbiont of Fragariocoptes setiger]